MSPILMWLLKKGLEAAAFEIPFKQWQAEYREKLRVEEAKKAEVPPAPPSLPPVTLILVALIGAFLSIGASCNPPQWVPQPGDIPDMQIYCCDAVLGHPDRCSDSMRQLLCKKTPTPTPRPAATATPTRTPAPTPTRSPEPPTPSPTAVPPTPTPEPCNAAPKAPDEPVSVLFVGRCPKGFERVEGYDAQRHAPPGTVICAARSTCMYDGHGGCPGIGDRASWAFGYNLNQGQVIAEFSGKYLIYDPERGCKDAYGRFFHEKQGCETLYTHPTDPNAIWTATGIAPAAECTPTPAPTQPPATPTPPVTGGCNLPRGEGEGLDCPRSSSRLLSSVGAATDRTIAAHPDWLESQSPEVIREGHENDFREVVVDELRAAGFCAFFDGEEIAVKNSNAFSEQYHVLSSARHIRRGEGSYRATCTPAWKAIPVAFTPTPPPSVAPPLLVLWRVGDDCSNPKDGPRFTLRHECVIDSSDYYRDPTTPDDRTHDGPCDLDHAPAWNSFCHKRAWGDPRGPYRSVMGAEDWAIDGSNPWKTVVKFIPGQSFVICTRPHTDVRTEDGIFLPVQGPAEMCRTHKYE